MIDPRQPKRPALKPRVRKGQGDVKLTREEFARRIGERFDDPEFALPIEWMETRARIRDAERRQKDPASPRRVLLVNGAARHDQTCPGEMSKSFRLAQLAREIVEATPQFEC